jgi:hypothetical protein
MGLEVAGDEHVWSERRLVVRALRQAQVAAAALRVRVAKAKAQVAALHVRGRGHKRYEDIETWRQSAHELVQRDEVAECGWLRYDQKCTTRQLRASRGRPAQVQEERQATVEGQSDEDALASAVRRLGWRLSGTRQPTEQ